MKRSETLRRSLDDVKYEQYVNNLHDRLPQLIDPSDIDCQRWPWELLQNAKDTVVKRQNPDDRFVDVTIKYYDDEDGSRKLYFEHNGDQFTNKAITGLIWKFSAEKRNEQTTEDGLTRDKQSTGRFGTGFMTTHALSLTVDVSGSLFHDDPDVMRNVSVNFTLHREGPNDEAYKAGVDKTEQEIDDNMDRIPIPQGEILPTRFTYHLNKEASEKAARMGIENIKANAAQTMLFCPSVRSITIEDDVDTSYFKITRKTGNDEKDVVKETEFIEVRNNISKPVVRRFISIELEEYSEILSNHWKTNDRNLRLHIAVEVDEDNNILSIPPTSPAVYCSLPLIGFESMSLPFYINSNDFEPATERTSLYLKKKRFEFHLNEDTGEEEKFYLQSGINWAILERSIPLYERIVDYLISNNYKQRYNLINGLGSILKGAWEKDTKNCLAARFILPLRSMLVKKELVLSKAGYKSIVSDVKFVECAKDCDILSLYEICEAMCGSNLAVEDENLKWVSLKWGRFTFEPDFDESRPESENPSYPIIKYDKVADYVEQAQCIDNLKLCANHELDSSSAEDNENISSRTYKLAWLNKLYEWIESSKITNLSERRIVPNRLGVFCSTEQGSDLKDASNIPTQIFDFMKELSIDWDEKLMMEGVCHITLAKETKDNIINAIKGRSKEIRDNWSYDDSKKLSLLLPLLLALPRNDEGRTDDFYHKRLQIISFIKTVYWDNNLVGKTPVTTLDLKAETWEESDKWLLADIAKKIASKKHIDEINGGEGEEPTKEKYCTAIWLAQFLNFMFEKQYLHQEDVTFTEGRTDVLSIFPNRYGVLLPINKLYSQGKIPNELLADVLKKTGYDIKDKLLYENFSLNSKVSISTLTIDQIAAIYAEFFKSDVQETALDQKSRVEVAEYLIHLTPECGDMYSGIRCLYDQFAHVGEESAKIQIVTTSNLNLWKPANDYLIRYLCRKATKLGNLYSIGKHLSITRNIDSAEDLNFEQIGLDWLNKLVVIVENCKLDFGEDVKLVPDWFGVLRSKTEIKYNGRILLQYQQVQELIDEILYGNLWIHFEEAKEEDKDIAARITHPSFIKCDICQDDTDIKVFDIIDRATDYCCRHYSTDWLDMLKGSIKLLLDFFDANKKDIPTVQECNMAKLFSRTYIKRKDLAYDFIYDPETKRRFSQINDNYTFDEIDVLIDNKEFIKRMLSNDNATTIQTLLEEFPETNFEKILNLLRRENGDYNTDRFQQSITDERKREIGDKGECFVYELLRTKFSEAQIKWSNKVDNAYASGARMVRFMGGEYHLRTTSHNFDFIVNTNDKEYYIEVKTTTSSIRNSIDFPLIFEPKEWEWIDNCAENSIHYIVRVFDVEGTPKAYFLKQELNVE